MPTSSSASARARYLSPCLPLPPPRPARRPSFAVVLNPHIVIDSPLLLCLVVSDFPIVRGAMAPLRSSVALRFFHWLLSERLRARASHSVVVLSAPPSSRAARRSRRAPPAARSAPPSTTSSCASRRSSAPPPSTRARSSASSRRRRRGRRGRAAPPRPRRRELTDCSEVAAAVRGRGRAWRCGALPARRFHAGSPWARSCVFVYAKNKERLFPTELGPCVLRCDFRCAYLQPTKAHSGRIRSLTPEEAGA